MAIHSAASYREFGRFVLALAIVSIGAAAFAVAFRLLLGLALQGLAGAHDVVAAIERTPVWARVLVPAAGGFGAGLIARRLARHAGGAGVGDVMEAVVLGRVHLSMRVTLLKSLASWLAIVSGGSLGREGPLIQFGGALGKAAGQRVGLSLERIRLLIGAGTAAGFAAAYNTPFAAVLFVVEVVTGIIVLDAVLPALIATVIATAITRALVGAGPIYGARAFTLTSSTELFAYAALGVITALVARGFMAMLAAGERGFARPWLPQPWRAALGGALAGSVLVVLPLAAGNGYEPLGELLDGRLALGVVAWLLIGKCIATTASVGSGSPGGVFTPTLLVGGAVGVLVQAVLASWLPVGSPGGYALVGMAAATAATTFAPLLAAVMVFELSGDYAIVLPLVLATAVATSISRALGRDSIYTGELRKRGVGWEVTMEGRQVDATPD